MIADAKLAGNDFHPKYFNLFILSKLTNVYLALYTMLSVRTTEKPSQPQDVGRLKPMLASAEVILRTYVRRKNRWSRPIFFLFMSTELQKSNRLW